MAIFILCVKIFLARICDVSIGTIRTIVTVKGKSFYAALLAFIEVFIWFNIAREALNTTLVSLWIPIAYAGGYAAGTLIGSLLSNKLIRGVVGVQIVTSKLTDEMLQSIRNEGFAVSVIKLETLGKEKQAMLYIQLNNFKLKKLMTLIKSLDTGAFIVVNETKYVQNGFIK